jgi:hypothetical protein
MPRHNTDDDVDYNDILEKARRGKHNTFSFYLPEDIVKRFKKACKDVPASAVVAELLLKFVLAAESDAKSK